MIQNGIEFTPVNEDYLIINKKISRDSYNKLLAGKNNPIINAISIDWNNAKVDDNTYINTTGELLSWIKSFNSNNSGVQLSKEQLEALNYLVDFVKQIKFNGAINNNDYFIYIGLNKPSSKTNPLMELAMNKQSLYEKTYPTGWYSIGEDISQYNMEEPAFDGGITTVCLDHNFDTVTCYVVIPVEMNIYDGLGNIIEYDNLGEVTIKGHLYKILSSDLEGEFADLIY